MPGSILRADSHPVCAKIWLMEPRLVWDHIDGGRGGSTGIGYEPGLR